MASCLSALYTTKTADLALILSFFPAAVDGRPFTDFAGILLLTLLSTIVVRILLFVPIHRYEPAFSHSTTLQNSDFALVTVPNK